MHARRAVQRIHAEAGIVRHGGKMRHLRDGGGLQIGVFLKGIARLVYLKIDARQRLGHHGNAEGLQNLLEFPVFPLIVRCENERHCTIASANSLASKGRRSSTPSPTPTSFTGTPSRSAMENTTPPFAVPSSFVRTMPVTPAALANCSA